MSRDLVVLVDDCTQVTHVPGPHHHVVFGGSCEHGVPSSYTCHSCERGLPAAPVVAELPADWETRGVHVGWATTTSRGHVDTPALRIATGEQP